MCFPPVEVGHVVRLGLKLYKFGSVALFAVPGFHDPTNWIRHSPGIFPSPALIPCLARAGDVDWSRFKHVKVSRNFLKVIFLAAGEIASMENSIHCARKEAQSG